ncbi:MAG TPA: MBG domain-containing protein, partial [Candidatus Saccharimonadales bacterium]|nr:MBG domain-containing protein [Candidatus Saccharimonadales bacterium]
TFVNGTLTITAVPLTVTAEAKTKVYGAPLPVFTASYVGFVNGDTPASLATPVSFATTASASSSVGTYPITPGGAVSPNYIFSYVGSTLTVTPALLTITADNKVKVFLGVVPTLTASYAGLVNGDTPANLDTPVTLTTTAEQTSPVGNYPITASGAADLNYVITLVNGTLMVIELPPQLVILGINAAGDVSLQITCQPGLTLDLEESPDLSVWTQLTRLEVTTGATTYVDVGGGNGPKKFYRLKVVP